MRGAKVVMIMKCWCGLQLLEACTEKLGLDKAARRLFLDNGREVLSDEDLDRDVEVYVSTGEPFKNPVKDMLRKCSHPVLCFILLLPPNNVKCSHPVLCFILLSPPNSVQGSHPVLCFILLSPPNSVQYSHPVLCFTLLSPPNSVQCSHPVLCFILLSPPNSVGETVMFSACLDRPC